MGPILSPERTRSGGGGGHTPEHALARWLARHGTVGMAYALTYWHESCCRTLGIAIALGLWYSVCCLAGQHAGIRPRLGRARQDRPRLLWLASG